MLTDNDKRDIEKQTGVALDKDQKGKLSVRTISSRTNFSTNTAQFMGHATRLM